MNINIELGTGLGWEFSNPFSYTTWQIIAACSKVISIAMHFEANILESKAKGAKDRINYGLCMKFSHGRIFSLTSINFRSFPCAIAINHIDL